MCSFSSDFAQLFSSPPNKDDRGGIGDAHSVKRKRESEEKEVSDESGRSVASNKQQQQQQQHFKGNQRGTCPPRRGHTQQQMPHHSGCAVQRVQNQGAGARAGAVVPEGRGPHWGKEPAMKDMEKRGQEIPKKSKKKKGKKQDNRGEGRQQRWRGTANGPPSFAKKQPYLSQEFISQHAIERDGRLFCKFFLSGRCIKEEACKFEHEFVVPDKKQELCKFYVFGFCTKGADCIYMHSDYPCKFFHTGTKCYQGDHCKFSHDPLTEVTRSLLEKVLNKNEEDEGKQENLVPSDTSPPPLSADSKPVQLGLRPNFYNSSSLVSGPPLPSVSSVTADKPAESLFPPLPPLEPLNSPSSSPHPAVPPGGSDSEGQKREAEVGHLQPIAVQGGSTCEEPDTEAGPKDTPVLIPLDLLPGVALKDPRRPNQTLSELTLSWPTFARTVDSLHRYKPLCCAPLLNTSTQEAPTANPDDETRDPSGTTEGQSLTTGPVDPPAAPPGRDGDVQYAESIAAPAVHNLPVPSLATWGRQAHTAPSDAGTQAKTSTVFRDMFKTPLPLLSSSDSTA